jgi:hypothetical protein
LDGAIKSFRKAKRELKAENLKLRSVRKQIKMIERMAAAVPKTREPKVTEKLAEEANEEKSEE